MTSCNRSLVLIVLLAAASQGLAQTALSDWTAGVATNYGGPNDGDNPNTPTFGLLDVSIFLLLAFSPCGSSAFPQLLGLCHGNACLSLALPVHEKILNIAQIGLLRSSTSLSSTSLSHLVYFRLMSAQRLLTPIMCRHFVAFAASAYLQVVAGCH